MGAIEEMNYAYRNPSMRDRVSPDRRIVEAFLKSSKVNNPQVFESFELWASMSKERNQILPIINNFKKQVIEKDSNIMTK